MNKQALGCIGWTNSLNTVETQGVWKHRNNFDRAPKKKERKKEKAQNFKAMLETKPTWTTMTFLKIHIILREQRDISNQYSELRITSNLEKGLWIVWKRCISG